VSFLNAVIGKIVDSIVNKTIEKLDERLDNYFNVKQKLEARDKRALEIKDMISIAQTVEERDVLLDQMDSLLRDTLRPE